MPQKFWGRSWLPVNIGDKYALPTSNMHKWEVEISKNLYLKTYLQYNTDFNAQKKRNYNRPTSEFFDFDFSVRGLLPPVSGLRNHTRTRENWFVKQQRRDTLSKKSSVFIIIYKV